jgi:hypothetical protein
VRREGAFVVRRQERRHRAGAVAGEECGEKVDDAEQQQADLLAQHPPDPNLVTIRHDSLAHVVEGTLQSVRGVRRGLVGHSGSFDRCNCSYYVPPAGIRASGESHLRICT